MIFFIMDVDEERNWRENHPVKLHRRWRKVNTWGKKTKNVGGDRRRNVREHFQHLCTPSQSPCISGTGADTKEPL